MCFQRKFSNLSQTSDLLSSCTYPTTSGISPAASRGAECASPAVLPLHGISVFQWVKTFCCNRMVKMLSVENAIPILIRYAIFRDLNLQWMGWSTWPFHNFGPNPSTAIILNFALSIPSPCKVGVDHDAFGCSFYHGPSPGSMSKDTDYWRQTA